MKDTGRKTARSRHGSVRWGTWLPRLALASSLGCSLAACVSRGAVVRRYDGDPHSGRVIRDEAYAHYARGAYLEAAGFYEQAADEYEAVLHWDVESMAAWTRLAAVLCASGKPAHREFERAHSLGERFAPYWHARAVCLERQGDTRAAVEAAERAMVLDPNGMPHTLLAARLHEQLGRDARAAHLLLGAVLRAPASPANRRALADFAERHRDPVLSRVACCAAGEPYPTPAGLPRLEPPHRATPTSSRARPAPALSMLEKAVCAASRGNSVVAKRLASSLLAADPDNADAAIALLYAADLTNDAPLFRETLSQMGLHPRLTMKLSRELYVELLARRLGASAAAAWGGAWPDQGSDLDAARCAATQPGGRAVPGVDAQPEDQRPAGD